MGVVIRQSGLSTISGYAGVLIGFVNTVVLMPLFMTEGEIGLYRTIMSIASLLASIALLGMSGTTVRFYPELKDREGLLGHFQGFVLVVSFVGICVISTAIWLLRDLFFSYFEKNAPEVNEYLLPILGFLLLMSTFQAFDGFLRANKNIITGNILRDVAYKLAASFGMIMFGWELFTFDGLITFHLWFYGFLATFSFGYLWKNYDFNPGLNLTALKNGLLQKISSFAAFSVVGGIGGSLVLLMDQIMISKYLGLAQTGIYTTSVFMAVVIELPRRFVSGMSSPVLAEYFHQNKLVKIKEYYKGVSLNMLILGSLIFLLIANNLDSIYALMPNGEKYAPGYWVMIIFGMAKLTDMTFGVNGEIIMVSKYYKWNIIMVTLLGILTVITNIILIPRIGIEGAALASLITIILFNVSKSILIRFKYGFQPFSWLTVVGIIVCCTGFLIGRVLPDFGNVFINILVNSVSILILYATWILIFKPSEQLTGIINTVLSKLGMK